MGNSEEKIDIRNKANEKTNEIIKKMQYLEKAILTEEIKNRGKNDSKNNQDLNNNSSNVKKFNLNIFLYTNEEIDERILNSIKQYNSEVFNWNIEKYDKFSQKNTEKIFERCEKDFEDNKFNNVVIIPIMSISYFENILEQEGKDILLPFNELIEEQQPFFLFIDANESDFNEYKSFIELKYSEKEKDELDYQNFNEEITKKIIEYKRKEFDFQINLDFIIEVDDKIKPFKEYILKLKDTKCDLEIFVNNELFYQYLYGAENFNIQKNNNNFEQMLEKEIRINNILQIKLILYNININEYDDYYYKLFYIGKLEITYYEFKRHILNNILRKDKYNYLDKRNFNVIRFKQTPRNILLRYTGYFNQIGDILFCDQINFYPAKINIAIGGYIGSGKSTLINTIFGEKRCLEGRGSSLTNYISQFCLKDYPINFYDFPGFRAKQNGKENYSLFIEEIRSKISDLKKINETIHCFLFCIKFEERIFDKNDEEMIKVFKALAQLKLRTFFIITGSEEEDSRQFQNFKKVILNNLKKVKQLCGEDGDIIFGTDLDKSIIPILSRDKIFHKFTAKAFGLDKIFKVLYDYFLPKKINLQKEIFLDEEKLKDYIKENELLKVFESQNKSSQNFKSILEEQFDRLIMKMFFKLPKYLYSSFEENNYNLVNDLIDEAFYIFTLHFEQISNVEKLQFSKKLYELKNKLNKNIIMSYLEDSKKQAA